LKNAHTTNETVVKVLEAILEHGNSSSSSGGGGDGDVGGDSIMESVREMAMEEAVTARAWQSLHAVRENPELFVRCLSSSGW
jgi:hypothetical protein